jgi:hypothetical protein
MPCRRGDLGDVELVDVIVDHGCAGEMASGEVAQQSFDEAAQKEGSYRVKLCATAALKAMDAGTPPAE